MIYAELAGGLGNQMFIYAFARALGLRCKEPVTLLDRQDWRDGAPAHTQCALQALNIAPEVRILTEPGFAKNHLPRQNAAKALMIKYEQRGGMMDKDYTAFEWRMAPLLNALGLHFSTDGFLPAKRGHSRDFLAWGYFQAEGYFAHAEVLIRAELRAKGDLPEAALPAAQAIAEAHCPVALHWRCGDYRKPENAALQVCGPRYYADACRAVRETLPEAQLFVFSDEPDYVQAHLDTAGLPAAFVRGTWPAAWDLDLMARCRHFILSNSTFSWWGQYLAEPEGRRVFAPDRWYANGKRSALYAPDWTLLPTGEG